MDATVYVAVISGLAAVVSAVYTARSAGRTTQKKTEAEERAAAQRAEAEDRAALRQIEAAAYERAREGYEDILTQLRTEVDRQARQINALQRQVSQMTRQIRDAGLVPVISSEEEGS